MSDYPAGHSNIDNGEEVESPEDDEMENERSFDLGTADDLGRKTSLARINHDESRARFHKDYFTRWLALKPLQYQAELREVFDAGYRDEYDSRKGFRDATTRF